MAAFGAALWVSAQRQGCTRSKASDSLPCRACTFLVEGSLKGSIRVSKSPKAHIPETEWKASSLAAQDVTWTRGDSKLSARGTWDDELQEPLA